MVQNGNVASTSTIRSHFPALERVHHGHPVAYFDGPGGTQVPRAVVEAMTDYLFHHNANTHWAYPTSHETDALLLESRAALADFLNATPESVVFGQNMTTLTFHLARALVREWSTGDQIIVTDLDHHANIDPWRDLARVHGLRVRAARFDPDSGELDWDHLESLVNRHTRLIAIGAASNAIGTINDIPRAAHLARSAGALSFVDAVHYAPHVLCDVADLGCDFLTCSPYKFYGPHAGVLYGSPSLLEELDVPRLLPAPSKGPERLETGTLSHEAIVGAAAAVDFLSSLSDSGSRRASLTSTYSELQVRAHALFQRLWDGLRNIPGVTCYGPPPQADRTPTLGFTVRGLSAEETCRQLAERGLFLSHGDFYAMTVILRLGVEGLVRAGCACYTTREEIDCLVSAVANIARS